VYVRTGTRPPFSKGASDLPSTAGALAEGATPASAAQVTARSMFCPMAWMIAPAAMPSHGP
jgi:hypothetical protein